MKQDLRIDCTVDLNQFISVVRAHTQKHFDQKATGICLDTRVIQPGDLFFAVAGIRDGHEFVAKAMEMGAIACVVSQDLGIENQILVSDTLQSLWAFAGWHRNQWGKKIVALSGSNGKTSTKEMIATLLGEKALKTPGTWNNFLGVPLTLLMLEKKHEYGVVEMGINHFGELLQLVRFTKPNIAVLTNVGPAHLQELHDLDGVAKAKGEIFSQMQSSDIAVINLDDSHIADMVPSIRAKIITVSRSQKSDVQIISKTRVGSGYDLTIMYGAEKLQVVLPIPGEHTVSNYLCSLGVAMAFGISAEQIVKRTLMIRQVEMRMQEIKLPGDRTIINDAYNANPGSFQASLQTVSETKPQRFLVLMGDMLELGNNSEKIHHEVGKMMSRYGVHHLFTVGVLASEGAKGAVEAGLTPKQVTVIEKKADAAQKILPYFKAGDILLVKGSRGMKLEEIVLELETSLKA